MISQVEPTRRYAFIDALRGLAFLGVLAHHVAPRVKGLPGPVATIANQGHEGVQLFFLISALTLFLSLGARRDTERSPTLNYFLRRFFRIAPLFYAGALFYFATDRIETGGEGPGGASLSCILSSLTFTNCWSLPWINRLVPGGWSVAVEMNFYLLVPWLHRKLTGLEQSIKAAMISLIGGGAATVAIKVLLTKFVATSSPAEIDNFAWYWLPAQMPIFCLGFALYFLIRRAVTPGDGEEFRATNRAPMLLAMALYLMIALTFSRTAMFLGHALFGVAFLLLAWSLALRPNRCLVNSFTCYLGQISFSAYISHYAILHHMSRGLEAPTGPLPPVLRLLILFAATLAATMLASTATYRLIEKPGQALGRRLIHHLETRETPNQGGEPLTPRHAPPITGAS